MPQEASKTPSDAPKTPQDASKRPPRPSKIDFSSQHGLLELQKTIKNLLDKIVILSLYTNLT